MVGIAQLVRAPDCDSGGRRFEPGYSPLGSVRTYVVSGPFLFWQPNNCKPFSKPIGAKFSPSSSSGYFFCSTCRYISAFFCVRWFTKAIAFSTVCPLVPGRVSRMCLCQPETRAKAKWSGLIQARQRHHTLDSLTSPSSTLLPKCLRLERPCTTTCLLENCLCHTSHLKNAAASNVAIQLY